MGARLALETLENAVRRVLPAVNLEPATFHLERGFLSRARLRGGPAIMALDGMARQLIFVGAFDDPDPLASMTGKAANAFESIPAPARAACERFVVAWTSRAEDVAYAAAFIASADDQAHRLVGCSWTSPEEWPEPMIDPATPGEEVLAEALRRLWSLVDDRRGDTRSATGLDREIALIDMQLEYKGGQGQDVSARPRSGASRSAWVRWLQRYELAVQDEWRRITGARRPAAPAASEPKAGGPLAGISVFLSYTKPDQATLALPVHEALRGAGATVWFDREQDLDSAWLNAGLAEAIAGCDAYVMCASDEFVERAGYATQEVAWALRHKAGARSMRLAVVARPGTVLPTLIASWPRVELREESEEDLGRRLAEALSSAHELDAEIDAPQAARPLRPTLPPAADLAAMADRVRHMRRYDELPQDLLEGLMAGADAGARFERARDRLRTCGDGLGWSGTLTDLDDWSEDPFVRDFRWRLGGARAVAGVRWPLSGDLREPTRTKEEVELLARRRVPLVDWEPVPGWADNERRLALRYHAGLLRVLQQLLGRGLFGGLLDVGSRTLETWEGDVAQRRRECYDALVTLRLQGVLSWKGEPPTWDRLFRSWAGLVGHPPSSWSRAVPSEARFLLGANVGDIAAVAAHVTWCAGHHGGAWIQRFALRNSLQLGEMTVYASSEGPVHAGDVRGLVLGIEAAEGDRAAVVLRWRGFGDGPGAGAQSSLTEAPPEPLRQGISFATL